MPIRISTRQQRRRKVQFLPTATNMSSPSPSSSLPPPSNNSHPSSRLEEILDDFSSTRIEELSDSSTMEGTSPPPPPSDFKVIDPGQDKPRHHAPAVPALFSDQPPIKDKLVTPTSEVQDKTIKECLRFLTDNPYGLDLSRHGVPNLLKYPHSDFLHDALQDYPAQFAAMDASRPWILYWALTGLSVLPDADVDSYRQSLVETFQPCQNETGGFGGGHGHTSHLAPSYAAVLSLATVGGNAAYEAINRKTMWQWLGEMKQPNGGFTMSANGEQDIRGAYCVLTIVSLLNLPLELPPNSPARIKGDETFLTGLGDWIAQCQTYEGGIGSAPGNEAHGAYTFCGLACLSIMDDPAISILKYLHLPNLISWLSSRQYAPEGGLAGRTNKLVDGCYSHWQGGCWSLVEAAVHPGSTHPTSLFHRAGLARYILSCAQGNVGGLRDKPSKPVDSYHTCYNLAGLSWAQHLYTFQSSKLDSTVDDAMTTTSSAAAANELKAPYAWTVHINAGVAAEEQVWAADDVVQPLHPVFVLRWGAAENMRGYFEAKVGF